MPRGKRQNAEAKPLRQHNPLFKKTRPRPDRAAVLVDLREEGDFRDDIEAMARKYDMSWQEFIRVCVYLATLGGYSGLLPTRELFNSD